MDFTVISGNKKFYFYLWNILLLVILAFSASCTKKDKNSKTSSTPAPGTLDLTGRVVSDIGTPVPGAQVIIPGYPNVIVLTDGNGSFSISLDNVLLTEIKAKHNEFAGAAFDNTFSLYFDSASTTNPLVGRSFVMNYEDRGVKDLGIITMQRPSAVVGIVKMMRADGEHEAVSNIKILADRISTISDAKGQFSLPGLTSNGLKIYAFAEGTSVSTTELTFTAGQTINLDYPLLVFPKADVAGGLVALPQNKSEQLYENSHPYRISFKTMASPNARYIKLHHDKEKMAQNSADGSEWRDISSVVSYDFPGNGLYTLHYQFADGKKSGTKADEGRQIKTSAVNSATIRLDPFYGSKGITIEDGSGIVTSRHVTINIDLPIGAAFMRFSEDPAKLIGDAGTPFIKADTKFEYSFEVKRAPAETQNNMLETNLRDLYCQFKAADGTLSGVYKATVTINVFPQSLKDDEVITLADNQTEWPSLLLPITIRPPEGAVEMRIFDEQLTKTVFAGGIVIKSTVRGDLLNTYIGVRENFDFLFLDPGRKQIFFQFRDKDGLTSRIFRKSITILRAAYAEIGFRINGGEPASLNNEVTLSLMPPPGNIFYRASEDPIAIANMPFSTIRPMVSFLTGGTGLRRIFVQYADIESQYTNTYTQEIYIDPFSTDPGNFFIYDPSLPPPANPPLADARVIDTPIILLNVIPPKAAVQMEITEAVKASFGIPTCGIKAGTAVSGPTDTFLPLIPTPDGIVQQELLIKEVGAHTICIRFKTINNITSPYTLRSVIYDPFDPNLNIPTNIPNIVIRGDNFVSDPTVTASREVKVFFARSPKRARDVRIASSRSAVGTAPLQPVSTGIELNWYLSPGSGQSDRLYTLYFQFVTENGDISSVYDSSIYFDPFPARLLTVTIICNSTNSICTKNTTDNNTELNLELTIPPTATTLKIADNSSFTNETSVPVTGMSGGKKIIKYKISGTTGNRTVYLKYIGEGGKESAVFSGSIDLDTI
ncbi:MAG: carboxypeptidase regulatory-like domain-containing protein [Oligoflexales bacterium]|nr:carboxypeptidase regulatory-like domain-containing protein [Oligoflexales bacterium]